MNTCGKEWKEAKSEQKVSQAQRQDQTKPWLMSQVLWGQNGLPVTLTCLGLGLLYPVRVSYVYSNKLLQHLTYKWLKTTEIYCCTVLEVRSLKWVYGAKIRVDITAFLLEIRGEPVPLTFPAACILSSIFKMHHSNPCSITTSLLSLTLSASFITFSSRLLPPSYKDPCGYIQGPPG